MAADHTGSNAHTATDSAGKAPAMSRSVQARFMVYSILLAVVCLAALYAACWGPDGDLSTDSPYHIGMADLFPDVALRRDFPWTQLSIWKDHFYDKELAFHLLLASVRKWAGLFGYDTQTPPFIVETAVLLALLIAVFYWTLEHIGVRVRFVWLMPFLLGMPEFTHRISLVRPQQLSIMLLLIVTAVIGRWEQRPKPLALFFLGVLFAYSHSNPHLVALPAGAYLILAWQRQRAKAFLPLVLALGGVIVGLTVHPQFPNTFIIWKIQCVDVVWQALTGRIAGVSSPQELEPACAREILFCTGMWIMLVLALGMTLWRRRRGPVPFVQTYLLVLALVCGAGFLRVYRTIEYAAPYSVLACAVALDDWLCRRGERLQQVAFAAAAAACLLLLPLQYECLPASARIQMPRQFAQWCRAHLPPGTYIANFYWDDFPRLFFALPDYVFAYGMDPMFSYAANPERHRRIEAVWRLRSGFPPPAELGRLLGSSFLFVPSYRPLSARRLAAAGYALAYQGLDGWCFDLDAPVVDPRRRPSPDPEPE